MNKFEQARRIIGGELGPQPGHKGGRRHLDL
jgi:hypothetical protein